MTTDHELLPFYLGRTYKTIGGQDVTLVTIHNAGTVHETMACARGIHRYTRRPHSPLDNGRTTGSATDCQTNLIPQPLKPTGEL